MGKILLQTHRLALGKTLRVLIRSRPSKGPLWSAASLPNSWAAAHTTILRGAFPPPQTCCIFVYLCPWVPQPRDDKCYVLYLEGDKTVLLMGTGKVASGGEHMKPRCPI